MMIGYIYIIIYIIIANWNRNRNIKYTIKFNATGVRTAGVDVQNYQSGAIVKSESFDRVPIDTLNTKGEVVVEEGGSKILLDRNGNGQVETLRPTFQVDGDLTDETTTITDVPIIVSDPRTISSGNQIATISLNIQTFKYLNNKPKDTEQAAKKDIKVKSVSEKVIASSTPRDKVELNHLDYTKELASPAGFFGNIVDIVWKFISELFNKIINLFK